MGIIWVYMGTKKIIFKKIRHFEFRHLEKIREKWAWLRAEWQKDRKTNVLNYIINVITKHNGQNVFEFNETSYMPLKIVVVFQI